MLKLSFVLVLVASAPAFAQHDHAHEEAGHAAALAAGLSVVGATFDTMFYVGNYEGVVPQLRWSNERFAVMANAAAYRLEKNGATTYGAGDVGVHAQAIALSSESFDAGVMLGVSLPTGDARRGLGMGHVMLMPALFGGWHDERLRAGASFGYSRALGGHHDDHGPWPLVSPMMTSELSWNAGGEMLVSQRVGVGARAAGGVPVASDGTMRAMIAARATWKQGRIDSAFELQAGIAGDPFTVRGVVSTALTFR